MRQTEFDFTRGEQLGWLREVPIENQAGISASKIVAVLRAIDSYGRVCYASQETLASVVKFSEKSVKRALACLRELDLITTTKERNPFGVVTNHYRVVWENLRRAVEAKQAAEREPKPIALGHQGPSVGSPCPSVGSPCPSVGSPCPSVGSPRAEREVMVTPKEYMQESSPTVIEPSEDWGEVEKELVAFGLKYSHIAIARARDDGRTFEQVKSLIGFAKRREWAPSVLYETLNGSKPWPTIEPDTPKPKSQRSKQADLERIEFFLAREWQSQGRWESATREQIQSEVFRRAGIGV